MCKFYVYKYIDPVSNLPFYIGKGTGKRMFKHLSETFNNTENRKKYAYIKGLRNKGLEPVVEIIKDGLSEQQAYDIEKELIIKYGRRDIDNGGILTNICEDNRPPNVLGIIRTEEFKRNLSESRKGAGNPMFGRKMPENLKLSISERTKGTKNPFYGKTHSCKQKEKWKGIARGMVGRKHTIETKKRMSEAQYGANNHQSKRWRITTPEGNVIIIISLEAFCKENNIGIGSLRYVARQRALGKNCVSSGGWICELVG